MIAKKSLNNLRFWVTFLPKKCVEKLLLPVKDNTAFTKIFTKTKNWKKWGTGAQWNNLIIFYTNQYDIILKLDLYSNKNKLSQKGDLLSQGHEKSFKKHNKDAYKNCAPAKK